MTHLRLATLSILLLLGLGACGKSEEAATPEVSDTAAALLSYVPADTPYLAGSLEPPPEDVIEAMLTRAEPVLSEMQNQLSRAKSNMEGADQGSLDDDPGARLVLAMLEELDGKLSREGFTSLGFDPAGDKVFYGMGAFPVARFGLSDAAVFRATVQRILERAEMTAPEQVFQDVSYWRLGDGGHDEPLAMYVAIIGDHLAVSLFPHAEEAGLLPAFLGVTMPSDSNAQQRLTALNAKYGYSPYGSGIFDVHKLADQFLDPDTALARLMAAEGDFNAAELAPECSAEVHEIIDNFPMMSAGTTILAVDSIEYQYRVHHPQTLAGELMELVAEIPAAESLSRRLMEFSFGMRFGAVRDFLRDKANAIVADPYQCEQLADLNLRAEEALVQLNQPMPPLVNNFRGVRASLAEFVMDPGQAIPQKAHGHLAVHVEQPQMFVGMAQMMLPDLSELALVPGEPPVAIPETLMPIPGAVAFAAMTDESIGMSLGAGEEAGLPAFLDRKNGPAGVFLSVDYDMAAYIEYTDRVSQAAGSEHGHQQNDAAQAIAEAAQEAIVAAADRSHTALSFSGDGLVIEGHMTFK